MSEQRDTGWARLSGVRIGAAIALALAAGFVVWLLVRGDDDSSGAPTTTQTQTTAVEIGPIAATPAALRRLSSKVGHAIYWVGPQSGRQYELTRTSGGRIYVRYLPPGAEIGNKRTDFTIVGTYPTADALRVLREQLSKQPNDKSASVPGGGLAIYSTSSPRNVHIAYPGSDVQIEVFDPSAKRALRLATSGRVVPVG